MNLIFLILIFALFLKTFSPKLKTPFQYNRLNMFFYDYSYFYLATIFRVVSIYPMKNIWFSIYFTLGHKWLVVFFQIIFPRCFHFLLVLMGWHLLFHFSCCIQINLVYDILLLFRVYPCVFSNLYIIILFTYWTEYNHSFRDSLILDLVHDAKWKHLNVSLCCRI